MVQVVVVHFASMGDSLAKIRPYSLLSLPCSYAILVHTKHARQPGRRGPNGGITTGA